MSDNSESAGSQLPLIIVLVVVIVGAIGFAVWNAWAPGKTAPKGENTAAVATGMPSMKMTDDAWSMPDPGPIDPAQFEGKTLADGVFGIYGKGSKVIVYACVPEEAGGCHEEAVKMLKDMARENGDLVKVIVTSTHSAAAGLAGLSCAGYLVNGSMHYQYTMDDGTVRKATFTKSSSMGAWSLQDLEHAVTEALEKAKSGDSTGPAKTESSPPTGPPTGPPVTSAPGAEKPRAAA